MKVMSNLLGVTELADQLRTLGLRRGQAVMVHSSFRSLGIADPELLVQALLLVLGDTGTLLTPALSYRQEPPLVHDTRTTPSCVGFFAEYMRMRPGSQRSLHPTHSACGIGAQTAAFLDGHVRDRTPCGPGSPFNKICLAGGKILMLGCGLRPNTTMHAIEEYVVPPYLFGAPQTYQITNATGQTNAVIYTPHHFVGVTQRYDRISDLLSRQALMTGMIGQAQANLIDAATLLRLAQARLQRNPWCFVEREPVAS
jgi:aminoglycoside 3-N-acetyltransferase